MCLSIGAQAWIVFLWIGLVAVFLVSLVLGGGGLIRRLPSGGIGAFGGFLFRALGVSLGIGDTLVGRSFMRRSARSSWCWRRGSLHSMGT